MAKVQVTFEGRNNLEVLMELQEFVGSLRPLDFQMVILGSLIGQGLTKVQANEVYDLVLQGLGKDGVGAVIAEIEKSNKLIDNDTPAEEPETTRGSDDEVTPKMVLTTLRNHVKKHGRDSALNILEGFGVTRASELKKSQLAEAQEKLNG